MTREEAYEILKTGICLICAYGCKNMDDCDISYCDIRDAVKTVMEEPCEDAWIINSLKEFLGESYSVLTSDKKEFTSWLERLRWHVAKCNELDTELRNYKKQVECGDAINYMGHPSTAKLVGMEPNRVTLQADYGSKLVVTQYDGPRLDEGVTDLPEGATLLPMKWEILKIPKWIEILIKLWNKLF